MRRLLNYKFVKWKKVFESHGLKVSLSKTRVMVSDSITQDSLSESKVDPCVVCILRVETNSVLCPQCGKWIHGGCNLEKRVTAKS